MNLMSVAWDAHLSEKPVEEGVGDLGWVPWTIVVLFGGSMGLGSCLVQTGAADWLAVGAVMSLGKAPGLWFVIGLLAGPFAILALALMKPGPGPDQGYL